MILWVDNNKVIAGSTVKSMYAVLRNGTSIGQSVAAMARVVGEGLPDLLPPRFQKSVGGVLDPLDPANLKGANGQVEVLGFRSGDVVKLIGSWAGSPTFDFKPLNSASRANFPLDSAFLAANMGKQLKLRYVLQRSGKLYDSQVLDASVRELRITIRDCLCRRLMGTTHLTWTLQNCFRPPCFSCRRMHIKCRDRADGYAMRGWTARVIRSSTTT
ncbi:hypothetical protein V5O39_10315 [Pseudomonas parakoreensis]